MLFAALLLAQTAPVCAAMDAALPPPLAGWTMTHTGLSLGHGGTLDVSNGAAQADFHVDAAGTYGIALDQPGWIDVSAKGASAALKSVKHGHGPDCSTIKKIVRFALKPGDYRLDLKNLKQAQAKIMLTRE